VNRDTELIPFNETFDSKEVLYDVTSSNESCVDDNNINMNGANSIRDTIGRMTHGNNNNNIAMMDNTTLDTSNTPLFTVNVSVIYLILL
jgi:hypothetical protein